MPSFNLSTLLLHSWGFNCNWGYNFTNDFCRLLLGTTSLLQRVLSLSYFQWHLHAFKACTTCENHSHNKLATSKSYCHSSSGLQILCVDPWETHPRTFYLSDATPLLIKADLTSPVEQYEYHSKYVILLVLFYF